MKTDLKYSPFDNKQRPFNILTTLFENKNKTHTDQSVAKQTSSMMTATYPLTNLDVEFIEGDVSCCDKDFFDERIDSLENCEIEEPRTVLIHIWWDQLPVLRHLSKSGKKICSI